MNKKVKKYIVGLAVILLFAQAMLSVAAPAPDMQDSNKDLAKEISYDSALNFLRDSASLNANSLTTTEQPEQEQLLEQPEQSPESQNSLAGLGAIKRDSSRRDSTLRDSNYLASNIGKNFLDDPITGNNKDSLVFDPKNKMVYIYNKGDVKYQNMNIKADYMRINMNNKEIVGYGATDTAGVSTRTEFIEGSMSYQMDTLRYNIDTKKGKIRGVATQEGEGYLIGDQIKKMPDNTINIAHGKYTTCSDTDHPHFYIAMTKAISTSGKNRKIIVGPSYLVMEDVPIYFLGIPFGFFPTMTESKSGFIIPTYGEEYVKGFFLRDGGYYHKFNDYLDATLTGGFYTYGSWQTELSSRYIKRYKYSGSFTLDYSKDIVGEKGDDDYVNLSNFKVNWSHSQDAKFRPNSTFSASVNFSTSGYSKYSSTDLNDYLNTQTSSSISYSKTWTGTPISFSASLQHSQNSQDSTVSLTAPTAVINVSRVYPFKRKEVMGKTRWYEKISFTYTGNMSNSVSVKENELFTDKMYSEMKNGIKHSVPVSTSLSLFDYINITPSASYTERWYFRKINKSWDDEENEIVQDTTNGFYRVYNYSVSASASTSIYGTYQFKGNFPVSAIRHVITPSIGFSFAPDFGQDKYGYYDTVQSDSLGNTTKYSPFANELYGVPSSGKTAAITFSLANSLEAKIRSKRDSTGLKKITIFDNLSASGSYNFLADSLNLSTISLSLRTTIYGNFGLNISAVLDPYQVDSNGNRINKFMIENGKIGRISSTGWSFGYSFKSKASNKTNSTGNTGSDKIIGQNNVLPEYTNFFDTDNNALMDPNIQRSLLTSSYYDFSVPWNLSFSYSMSYTNNGITKNVTQTLGFNGNVSLTPKTTMSFSAGYDFEDKSLTPGTVSIARDLHCWTMGFSWIPIGYLKSWSFNIQVKSSTLQDLKYDKSSSVYDTLYDN